MSLIMFSRSGGEDGKILIIGRGVRNRAAIVAQSGLERVVALSTHTCGSRSMREHERALVLFLIYTSYVYYFVNCVQLCLFSFLIRIFFSIELTYVLFVIKDTQGG